MLSVRFAFLTLQRISRLGVGLVFVLIAATGAAYGDEAKKPRLDLYGDPLPTGALARLGTVRLRHGDWLRSIMFSPDGKTIASVGEREETIRLWDASSGREAAQLKPEGELLGFAADGRSLTLACDTSLRQWDFHAKRMRTLWQQTHSLHCAAISPDGKLLAAADDEGAIVLRDAATGKEVRCLSRRKETLLPLLFAHDGKVLVSGGSDGMHPFNARVLDVATGRELRCTQQDEQNVWPLALSPDGRILVTTSEEQLDWWDITTGKNIRSLAGEASCAAFTSDGRLLAAAHGDQFGSAIVSLWRVRDGKEMHRWTTRDRIIKTLVFSPDDKLLAIGGMGGAVRLVETAGGKELFVERGHVAAVNQVLIAASGRSVLTSGEDDSLLWETATGRLLRRFPSSSGLILSSACSADGRTVAVLHDESKPRLHLWDAATGTEIRPALAQGIPVTGAAFSHDGKYLFTMANGAISVWDIASGKEVRTLGRKVTDMQAPAPTSEMACSPDGRWLAESSGFGAGGPGGGATVSLWDLAAGREHQLHQQPRVLTSPAFSADSKVLLAMEECFDPRFHHNYVRIWEVESGKPRSLKLEKVGDVSAFALAPDGEILATAEEKRIRLWDIASGAELRHFDGHRGASTVLAFSADGRILVSGSAGTTALVWDVGGFLAGRERRRIDLSRQQIEALWRDLAGDAACAGESLWKLIAGRQTVAFLKKHLHPVAALDISRLKRLLAELDSGEFAVREQATRELEKLGELAVPQLRKVLENRPSLETRRRIEDILARQPAIDLRLLRAIEILEHIGGDDARRLLRTLAEGAAEARLTREARSALKRLERLRR